MSGFEDFFGRWVKQSFFLSASFDLVCSTPGIYVIAAVVVFTVCFLCHREGKLLAALLQLDFRSALAVLEPRATPWLAGQSRASIHFMTKADTTYTFLTTG